MKYKKTTFSEEGLALIAKMSFKEFEESFKGAIKGDLKEAYKTLGGGKDKKATQKSKSDEERKE